MRKSIASLLLVISFFLYSKETRCNIIDVKSDSIVYNKNTKNSEERILSSNLKEKYAGKDFDYKEDAPVKKEKSSHIDAGIFKFLVFFMSTIFPFLLAGFIIFVILKALIGFDVRFWKQNKTIKRTKEKLIYEDEDIHKVDFENLLNKAIDSQNFRLAIRYYYLMTLKCLSDKKIIDYHKDKTNSEYLFEIENTAIRSKFSYLSYVYTYVWYGEFPVDEKNFIAAQNKYQSFINRIL
tara:strand:+ start:1870 stop:2580 length:711 start_codon:yes stop_codon:yes gene_type:complete